MLRVVLILSALVAATYACSCGEGVEPYYQYTVDVKAQSGDVRPTIAKVLGSRYKNGGDVYASLQIGYKEAMDSVYMPDKRVCFMAGVTAGIFEVQGQTHKVNLVSVGTTTPTSVTHTVRSIEAKFCPFQPFML